MNAPTREKMHRDRRVIVWLSRLVLAVSVVVLVLTLIAVNRKADRVACIDNLEVSWRIDVGEGVSRLIRNETAGLEASADSLERTTGRLREVESGARCTYESPFPGY